MIGRFVITGVTFIALTVPALAQFPPPGIYACVDAAGATFGTLTLLVAGDYAFDGVVSGAGQVASSGANVNAVSGPLAEMHLRGSFSLDERGEAAFLFETDLGGVECKLPEA